MNATLSDTLAAATEAAVRLTHRVHQEDARAKLAVADRLGPILATGKATLADLLALTAEHRAPCAALLDALDGEELSGFPALTALRERLQGNLREILSTLARGPGQVEKALEAAERLTGTEPDADQTEQWVALEIKNASGLPATVRDVVADTTHHAKRFAELADRVQYVAPPKPLPTRFPAEPLPHHASGAVAEAVR
jgi:hypothetical protein